jgi:hypothetical protein
MNRSRFALAGFLLVLVALIPSGPTFAKELVQITIMGPGLAEALELTDAQALAAFDLESVMEASPAQAPTELDADYFEVQLAVGDGTEVVATFVYHYFPALNLDEGYLYYADFIGGSADGIGQWFALSDSLDHDLRHLLRAAGVRFGVRAANCDATEPAPSA